MTEGMDGFEEFSPEQEDRSEFISRIHYFGGEVSSATDLKRFDEFLRGIEFPGKPANRLHYLALPPSSTNPRY